MMICEPEASHGASSADVPLPRLPMYASVLFELDDTTAYLASIFGDLKRLRG